MPCYRPLHGWYSKDKTEKGLRRVVFNPTEAYDSGHQVEIPCGRCIGCRLERSRQWAMRCLHEAQLHEKNCFITLTYKVQPENMSLRKEDFTLFMKRLRRMFPKDKIRYYQCGEYGELCKNCGKPSPFSKSPDRCVCGKWTPGLGRPHHHACLFNFDFEDKKLHTIKNGIRLYTSEILAERWGHGNVLIGDVTFESAAYVARYIMKKILGKSEEEMKEYYGEREPEYTTMSRREGIGKGWYEKYKGDVFPHDYTIIRGKKMRPPKYYDGLLEKEDIALSKEIKEARKCRIPELTPLHARLAGHISSVLDMEPERLEVKEFVKRENSKAIERNL